MTVSDDHGGGSSVAPPSSAETDPLAEFVEEALPRELCYEIATAIDGGSFGLGAARIRRHELGCDVLVEAWWNEQRNVRSTRSSPVRPVSALVMYFHRPASSFPALDVRPRKGNRLVSFVAGIAGIPTIDMRTEPEFAKQYVVLGGTPGARRLLDRATIDALIHAGDLHLKTTDIGAVVYRQQRGRGLFGRKRSESDDDWKRRLVLDASLAVTSFVDDPHTFRRPDDGSARTQSEMEARALLQRGSGLASEVRKRLVPKRAVEALRDQPTPRLVVDASIWRRVWGSTGWLLVAASFFAFGFLGGGAMVLFAAPPASGTGGGGSGGGVERLVGSIFLAMGTLATIGLVIVLRYRASLRRTIRDGVVVPASIESLERTEILVNGERIHRVIFGFEGEHAARVERSGKPFSVRISEMYVDQARRLYRDGTPTWVLLDPANPKRGLWPEGWVLDVE